MKALLLFLFFFFYGFCILFIYLILAALDLHCWMQTFSRCGEKGLLLIAAHGLLIAVASPAAGQEL